MKTTSHFLLIFCLVAGLFAFPARVNGAAGPITAYKTLTGLDFLPTTSNLKYMPNNGGIFPLSLVPSYGFQAPLHLPSGATVTEITFFYYDGSTTANMTFSLLRYNPETDSFGQMASSTTTGTGSSRQTINLPNMPVSIDNSTYAYQLRVEFLEATSNLMLFGARITYTVPAQPPGDDYLTFAGTDFQSSSSDLTYTAFGSHLYATAMDSSQYFSARLDLPNGAQVKQVDYYVLDNDSNDMDMHLCTHTLATSQLNILNSTSTSSLTNSPNKQKVTRLLNPIVTIDNHGKSYFIAITLKAATSNLQIVGARVRYTPPSTHAAGQVKTFSGINFFPIFSDLPYKAAGAGLYAQAISTAHSFEVNADVPDGYFINKITFYVIDAVEDYSFLFTGRLYYPGTGLFHDAVTGNTSGLPFNNTVQQVTFSDVSDAIGPVNNRTGTIHLLVEPQWSGSAQILVGVQVEYSPKFVYLPVTIK
jgi:hypothetical protein